MIPRLDLLPALSFVRSNAEAAIHPTVVQSDKVVRETDLCGGYEPGSQRC